MSERRPARARAQTLAAFAALLFAVLAQGCAQEGRLIETPLPVNGVAYDLSLVTPRDSVVLVNLRLKISVHVANACEARRGLLELRSLAPPPDTTFIIRPVARYNLDDPCTAVGGGPLDTVLTLTVTNLYIARNAVRPFRVETVGNPDIFVGVDSTFHAPTASTVRFQVRVESKTTGVALTAATVVIDQLGPTPATLGTATWNGSYYALDASSAAAAGVEAIPYRITVTNGSDTQVISVPSFPARGQSRERVVVRI